MLQGTVTAWLLLACFGPASAQTIVTVAGLPYSHRKAVDSQPALSAPLGNVHSLLIDSVTRRLLFTDGALLNRVEPDGSILVIAGMGRGRDGDITTGTLASGLATLLGFDGIAQDAGGRIYLGDLGGRIQRIESNGTVSVFAGGGTLAPGFPSDGGPATAANLSSPRGMVFDSKGNLDIAEVSCHCIRQVSPGGIITTLYTIPNAGSQLSNYFYFEGLSIDGQDNLYGAEFSGSVVVKIAPDGSATTIAGTGVAGFGDDGGPATAAQLNGPSSAVPDANGNVYIADTLNNRIRRIATDGSISTVAGTGQPGFSGDGGPAATASIKLPAQVIVDSSGNLYFGDFANDRVRRVGTDGTITTIAGSGIPDLDPNQLSTSNLGDGGPALTASLNDPVSPIFDASGSLLFADRINGRVRKITLDGRITTIAGNGQRDVNYAGGGPAMQAAIMPTMLAMDSAGALYIQQNFVDHVFRLNADGTLTLVAGGGEGTGPIRFSGDGGAAVSAIFNGMNGLYIDPQGDLFITDEINTRVREVSGSTGIVNTIAGPGQSQPGVDYWGGLVADAQGNLYTSTAHAVPPNVTAQISRINCDGSLTPVAGNQQPCTSGNFTYEGASALEVPLCSIGFLNIDARGVIYFGAYNAILALGTDGKLHRVAGAPPANQTIPHSIGDGGLALDAEIGASGVTFDAQGHMIIADAGFNRIREIIPDPVTPHFSQSGLSFLGTGSQTISVLTNVAEPFPYAVAVQTDGNLGWLSANRVTGQTGDALIVTVNPAALIPGTWTGTVSATLQNGASASVPVTLIVRPN